MSHILMTVCFQANEYSLTLPRGPASHGVLGFHSNMLPSNLPCEDRQSSATCLAGRGGVLFGVFDGHTGPACAHAVSQRLFYYIAVAALPLRTLAELERAVEEERAVTPLLEWHKYPQDLSYPNGGVTSFHSLRNYWQERLETEEEVTRCPDTSQNHIHRQCRSKKKPKTCLNVKAFTWSQPGAGGLFRNRFSCFGFSRKFTCGDIIICSL